MENQTLFSPLSDSQPSVPAPLPSRNPKPNFLVWIGVGLTILAVGIVVGLAVGKYSSKPNKPLTSDQSSAQIFSYDDCIKAKGSQLQESYPATCVTVDGQRFIQPVSAPTAIPTKTADSTANWKTYQGETIYTTDGSTIFQIKYPTEWGIEKNMLYPFGRLEDKGLETRIILGAGGHGWSGKVEKKIFSAGEANYSWVNSGQQIFAFASFEKNKQTYIIEIVNLPSANEKEYKALFDQILSTFRFME